MTIPGNFRGMAAEEVEVYLRREAERHDLTLILEQNERGWRAALMDLETAPQAIAPGRVIRASAEGPTRQQAMVGLAERPSTPRTSDPRMAREVSSRTEWLTAVAQHPR